MGRCYSFDQPTIATRAFVLCRLLEDLGHITETACILGHVNRIKQNCFQFMTNWVSNLLAACSTLHGAATETALTPIHWWIRSMMRLPHNEARSLDHTGISAFGIVCHVWTENEEAKGLESELEWMSEMTEDEYNELTPRTRLDVDRIRLHLNKERLKKYFNVKDKVTVFIKAYDKHVCTNVSCTHNRFAAVWILSGTTRVSLYQKKTFTRSHLS